MTGEGLEYRLSWEAFIFGAWAPSERVAGPDSDILDQRDTMIEWQRSGREPIRNVKLEQREPGGWEPVP